MDDRLRERFTRRPVWMRALFMVFYVFAFMIAEALAWAVVIAQFLMVLLNGRANERLLRFGSSLSSYVREVLRFLTFNTEAQPFPFSSWPTEPEGDNIWTHESFAPQPPTDEVDKDG